MLISQLIAKLQEAKKIHGDIEALVEVADTDGPCVTYVMKPVGEVSVENREGHGPTAALLV